MATITNVNMSGFGSRTLTATTLSASDSFEYVQGKNQTLVIENGTGTAITPNIVGDAATTVSVRGVGTVDVSAGYDVPSIADGEAAAIPLDSIYRYLAGDIAMTGADGATAYLFYY